MLFLLNFHNVFDYLVQHNLCNDSERDFIKIELVAAKNFNLLVTFPDNRQLLVKQERHNEEGKAAGELLREWLLQEFLKRVSEVTYLRSFLPEILHFDRENSIIVLSYLNDYRDLMDFYTKENHFPKEIAAAIGTLLATIHRETFNRQDYQDLFSKNLNNSTDEQVNKLIHTLERIKPEIFGLVPAEGLKFFVLYQRYDSLGQAISKLSTTFKPCCLTHNDLKLNNILLYNDWEQLVSQAEPSSKGIVRLIDWERSSWGEPAFDLGTIIGSYLQMWLNSLLVSKAVTIEESLRLATTPLDKIQPSIAALTSAYLEYFPEIVNYYPDFIGRAVQYSGLALIQAILSIIQYQKSFGNTGICMLQVAKTLLCRPEQSIPTVFGTQAAELTYKSYSCT